MKSPVKIIHWEGSHSDREADESGLKKTAAFEEKPPAERLAALEKNHHSRTFEQRTSLDMTPKAKPPIAMQERYRTIGAMIREARESKGLSYAEVVAESKMHEKFLRAIEEGHTDYLPANVYFPLFAKTYSEVVGLDPAQLWGDFFPENDAEPQVTSIQATPQKTFDPEPTRHSDGKPTLRKGPTGRLRIATRAAIIVLAIGAIYATVRYGAMNDGLATDRSGETTPDPGNYQSADLVGSQQAPPAESVSEPRRQLKLTVRAIDSVWAVILADGDTVFNRNIRTGEEVTWLANYRFRLRSVRPERLALYIDGQPLKPLTMSGTEGVEINQLNYRDLIQSADPKSASLDNGN